MHGSVKYSLQVSFQSQWLSLPRIYSFMVKWIPLYVLLYAEVLADLEKDIYSFHVQLLLSSRLRRITSNSEYHTVRQYWVV